MNSLQIYGVTGLRPIQSAGRAHLSELQACLQLLQEKLTISHRSLYFFPWQAREVSKNLWGNFVPFDERTFIGAANDSVSLEPSFCGWLFGVAEQLRLYMRNPVRSVRVEEREGV